MSESARVCGYEHAHQALCDHRLVQSMYGECNVLMERVLLTLHGEAHTCRRAIEWRLFRRDFARFYESEVYPATLQQTLEPYLHRGVGVWLRALTLGSLRGEPFISGACGVILS